MNQYFVFKIWPFHCHSIAIPSPLYCHSIVIVIVIAISIIVMMMIMMMITHCQTFLFVRKGKLSPALNHRFLLRFCQFLMEFFRHFFARKENQKTFQKFKILNNHEIFTIFSCFQSSCNVADIFKKFHRWWNILEICTDGIIFWGKSLLCGQSWWLIDQELPT